MSHTFETQFGGKTLTIETGKLARLAGGAVTVRYGDTLVLGTANRSDPRPGVDEVAQDVDVAPLEGRRHLDAGDHLDAQVLRHRLGGPHRGRNFADLRPWRLEPSAAITRPIETARQTGPGLQE